jgi:hypothetical protein
LYEKPRNKEKIGRDTQQMKEQRTQLEAVNLPEF